MSSKCMTIIFICMILPALAQSSSPADFAGTLVKVPLTGVSVLHHGKRVTPDLFYLVHDGDSIWVSGSQSVTFQPADGSAAIIIDKYSSGHPITSAGSSQTLLGRVCEGNDSQSTSGAAGCVYEFFASLGRSLSGQNHFDTDVGVTRGPGAALHFALPGLIKGTAVVAAGSRFPGFEFHGGLSPFQVTVAGPHADLLPKTETVDRRIVFTGQRNLVSGAYVITVTDARGAQAIGRFTALSDLTTPHSPRDLAPASLAVETRALVDAMWLAKQEPERFSLEAYFELVPLRNRGDENAETAMGILADGGLAAR